MSAILIDTNVLLDVSGGDPHWGEWSVRQLDAASVRHDLIINDVIFAELSVGFTNLSDVESFLSRIEIEHMAMPQEALFAAGKAFGRYRRQGGTKVNVLADFFIGAHAAVTQVPILTRDVRRYRTYFPTVRLIAPPIN